MFQIFSIIVTCVYCVCVIMCVPMHVFVYVSVCVSACMCVSLCELQQFWEIISDLQLWHLNSSIFKVTVQSPVLES